MTPRIADLLPSPIPVNLGRGVLLLNGLDLESIARLISTHRETAMSFIAAGAASFDALLLTAPQMVADIIASAAGVQDQREDVLRIPAAIQLECMGAIYKLSVPDEKKFKELLESLAEKLRQANLNLQDFLPPSSLEKSLSSGSTS